MLEHPEITRANQTGNPLPFEPQTLGKCRTCGERLTDDYEHVIWEDLYFCDREHFISYMKKNHGLEEVG